MSAPAALARLEDVIDASGVAPRIEARLPIGVRHRQLRVRTLLAGMLLSQADQRPAHLTRVRDALIALPAADQARLGVIEDWKSRPAPAHLPADRAHLRPGHRRAGQRPARRNPSADPRPRSATTCWRPASRGEYKQASRALAVDWSDVETFSRPPPHGTSDCADPEASWGHRNGGGPRPGQRAVLRLLPVGRHHDARGTRPAGPRAGPPDDRVAPATPTRPAPWSRC